jgi:hypothetical protein
MHCCVSSGQNSEALQLYEELQALQPIAGNVGQADAVTGCHRAALAAHCAQGHWDAAQQLLAQLLTGALPIAEHLQHGNTLRGKKLKAYFVLLRCSHMVCMCCSA